jgi:hypothetical protein
MRQLGAAGPDRSRRQSLPCWRSFNPLFRRAGSIAPPLGPHRGGLELSTGTGLYGACRSTQCCLAVWSRWVESSTRLGGFRTLKKTTEAPYTTKVNYRKPTSRGTTRHRAVCGAAQARMAHEHGTRSRIIGLTCGSVSGTSHAW